MRDITSRNTLTKYVERYHLQDILPDSLFPYLKLYQYRCNDFVTRSGEKVEHLDIVVDGIAKVSPFDENGKLILLNFLYPMDLIGEIEYFSGSEYLHTVIAAKPLITVSIPNYVLDSVLMHNESFLRYMCHCLAAKLVDHSNAFAASKMFSAKTRFTRHLLNLTDKYESDTVPYSISEVSLYLGITSRHLRRLISDYVQQNAIQKSRSSITVLDEKILYRDAKFDFE